MGERLAAWRRHPRLFTIGAIAVAALALAILWLLLWEGPDLLAHHDVGSTSGAVHETALDNARGRLLTLAAGVFAAAALVFTALNFDLLRRTSERTDQWQRRTHELAEQGQVTDRYTKAIEQLGSGELDARIGGIYALERIARDSTRDHPTVMEVITAFIREHSGEQWPKPYKDGTTPDRSMRPDVQAAVNLIRRRNPQHDFIEGDYESPFTSQLYGSTGPIAVKYGGIDLSGAFLGGANLTRANFTGADLGDANIAHTSLRGANLSGANLSGANLTGGANLTDANFTGANLTGADLDDDANAGITGGTILTGARFDDADLSLARWSANAPVPEGWTRDPESGQLERASPESAPTEAN